MKENQIARMMTCINRFNDYNIKQKIFSALGDKSLIKSTKYGDMTAIDLISDSTRVFNQFYSEINGSNGIYLPDIFFYRGNQVDIVNYAEETVNTLIRSNDFATFSSQLKFLVNYQMTQGFWDRSKTKIHSIDMLELQKAKLELDAMMKVLSDIHEHSEVSRNDLNDLVSDANDTIQKKTSEFNELTDTLREAQRLRDEIEGYLDKSVSIENKMSVLRSNQETEIEELAELSNDIKDKIRLNDEEVSTQKKNIDMYLDRLKKQHEAFALLLDNTKKESKYFEERNEYLKSLIGREVGASLFETFNKRKDELKVGVKIWGWAVPMTTIAFVAWVWFLFKTFPASGGQEEGLLALGVNTLKAIPALLLWLFTISQYNKERHYQEEYAFKSAVALTIKAYADILGVDESKNKLILDSVSKVYSPPSAQEIKHKNEKDVMNNIEKVVKLLNELKGFKESK